MISINVNFKISNFPTTRSISTTHVTLVNDSSFSNEGPSPLLRENDSEIVKKLKLTTFKIFFSRNTANFNQNLAQKPHWVKEISVSSI